LKRIIFDIVNRHRRIRHGHKIEVANLDKIYYRHLPKKRDKFMRTNKLKALKTHRKTKSPKKTSVPSSCGFWNHG
jgi:hypothetical protein